MRWPSYTFDISDNAGGKSTHASSLQAQTVSTFNYAQDFETRVKESIKKYFEFEVGCPHEKWPVLSDVWYFQAFVTTLGYMSLPAVQTVTKEDEVVMRDWIENFRPVWQQIVRLTAEAKRKFLCQV